MLRKGLQVFLTYGLVAGAFQLNECEECAIDLSDVSTGISGIKTIFKGEAMDVTVSGLSWDLQAASDESVELTYRAFANDMLLAEGSQVLNSTSLPDSLEVGSVSVEDRGSVTIRVEIAQGSVEQSVSRNYQSFRSGVAIIPLLLVLIMSFATKMVEFTLFVTIFVGACIIQGEVNMGFKETLENYILNAIADVGHGYVILFSLFLSGLVGMMEKSGGMLGFTKAVAQYATTSRSGQMCAFFVGCFVFFDDYANVLLAGETMRPLLDSLSVSREKLAFIVDATAAPVASISPVSSWVGFEVGLIQDEIDRIIELEGTDELSIKTSGMAVFLQSIRYRYYPIFMLVLMVALIYTKREFGPMLVAERRTQVYKRIDGGDGKGKNSMVQSKANQPEDDTPLKAWNMVFPVFLLVFFIFYLLVKSGEDDSISQTIMDKIESSDSYQALLWGTMAAALLTLIFYMLQIVDDGQLAPPLPTRLIEAARQGGPRFLMSISETTESFLFGMNRIFPAVVVLNLAWAVGSMMKEVGADRLFARWLTGGIAPESLPTLTFIISLFMALATGTSWGTMTILFPMVLLPTWIASEGDATIFYATTAGILSGSVAGDHISPISDTTVLTALACDCNLVAHVSTQMWYAIVVSIVSILLGTLPIGYDAWPNIVGILLGVVLIVLFVYSLCAPVLSPTGRFDPINELLLKFKNGKEKGSMQVLKDDTINAYNSPGNANEMVAKGKSSDDSDSADMEDIGIEKEQNDAIDVEENGAVTEE